ncbi:MAG: DUF1178 family protein [Pseudomonadota bacterium]
MIRYRLICGEGHDSESWFHSADAYDALVAAGHLNCPVCGTTDVGKALMAPQVRSREESSEKTQPVTNAPDPEVMRALKELRTKVEANSDYVGTNFAKEARAMHLGDMPERSIYGEARMDEAKSLVEDGVALMPLPFRPTKKLS